MEVFLILQFLSVLFRFFLGLLCTQAHIHHYKFEVKEVPCTRLCSTKNILTVNGQFPGPTLHLRQGDTILVVVYNFAPENITIHWHGVKQPRHPWSDGPEYITQCPIKPATNFTQQIDLSDEIGTLWWHAHSDWSRATVHGLLLVYPQLNDTYPFPMPFAQVPVVLGEWWKSDIKEVLKEFLESGGNPNISDAFLINGQPGDLYPCSKPGTYKLTVEYGKTYLVRMVNAAMSNILFFAIAKHKITVVGTDGSYTKPLQTDYVIISPGQTIDFLLEANQSPNFQYYIAAKAYNSAPSSSSGSFDNTTTTAILQYQPASHSFPIFPNNLLPYYNDSTASMNFTGSLRSLASQRHPVNVPLKVNTHLFFTLSLNTFPCPTNITSSNNNISACDGPGGRRLAASVNNISFVSPDISVLEAYYYNIKGIYEDKFPSYPPVNFNFTGDDLPVKLQMAERNTMAKVVEYNATVELVLQGTNLVAGTDHPMHLHGHNFYVVGWGLGNFNNKTDPLKYNLVDPPHQNTIAVPRNGWVAIRFKANNPGVWLLHCHLERHISWGMEMVFIVKDGNKPEEKILPPPQYMPAC